MEKELQESARTKLIEGYSQYAFEQMALYTFWGKKYEAVQKQAQENSDRITAIEAEVKEILGRPDYQTVANRNRVKVLKGDIEKYRKNITATAKGREDLEKKLVGYQQKAGETLEQIEEIRSFKLRTPEEVAEAKREVSCAVDGCDNKIPASAGKTHCMIHAKPEPIKE